MIKNHLNVTLRKTFIVLLVLGFTACILPLNLAAYAFTNGQSATTVIGQSSFTTNDFTPNATRENSPIGLAFDSSGNLWVADDGNNRVLEYTAPFSNGEAATTVIGQPNFTSFAKATTATGENGTSGLAFDSSGNLWVADFYNSRVLEYKKPFSNGEAASLVIGQPNFTTNTSALTATGLHFPSSLKFDSSGNLWVVDEYNDRVLEYTAPFSNGEAATTVIGQPNFTTNNCVTTATELCVPYDLAFDSSGNLWVTDQDNKRVIEYTTPLSTGEAATTVIGQPNFTTNTSALTATGFIGPYGIAFDSSGNLWVTDQPGNRALEFLKGTGFTNGEAATTVIGQPSFTTGTGALTATGLNNPYGIGFDPSGNLWIVDFLNDRVLGYSLAQATVPEFPIAAILLVIGFASVTMLSRIKFRA
ncbi:putative NHL repeat protein [Nitrosotalea sinensis]|uniref:Putative NHL repeat protein n=1 Tax=Nitrosotalea sinensis TaxID=1499975 RepID=A0A2H1EFW0_9ARCH|nr:NHL repeat-containing protein [Candidatus Nitrosotalea sinensis]SHO44739.1 putative NHL repeat protein [Candidatus Nitrosotalea sinensis]